MRLIIIIPLLFLLPGCATISNLVSTAAEANDNAIQACKFTLCGGASYGAIKREFNTKAKAGSLTAICSEDDEAVSELLNN